MNSAMESTELYQQILGLPEPWFVQAVALDANAATVTIQLAQRTGKGLFPCPRCQQRAPVSDHSETRTWRHLDPCQFETLLQAQAPRVNCPKCGVHPSACRGPNRADALPCSWSASPLTCG